MADSSRREHLMWKAVSAASALVGAGITRLISERVAAAGWEKATGAAPPGLRT